MQSFVLGQIEDTRLINGSSFFCAEEFAFINLHSLTSLTLGDLTFMSAKSFLIKSTQFDDFCSPILDLTSLTNLKLGHFAFLNAQTATFSRFSLLFSLIPRSPRIKQLHPRRSVHWLQRAHLAELTLLSSLIAQTFPIFTPSHRTTLSSSPPSPPRSSSTAADNSSLFAAASILSASPLSTATSISSSTRSTKSTRSISRHMSPNPMRAITGSARWTNRSAPTALAAS